MSSSPQEAHPSPPSGLQKPSFEAGLSAAAALSSAFDDTLQLLLQPFDAWRWIKFSAVCVLLGGGASSAAFNWSLGALPAEANFRDALDRARQVLAEHFWLILLASGLSVTLAVSLLYLRATFRFVLVDSILRGNVHFATAWVRVQARARSYFVWLFGASLAIVTAFSLGAILIHPYLRTSASASSHSLAASFVLAGILISIVLIGLLFALLVVLTDDLAVPLMYAEGLPVSRAWRNLWQKMRAEPGRFAVYMVLRLVVSIVVGMIVVFLLFPVLVGFFSGVIIVGALAILSLHFVGLIWVWNPVTIILAAVGLLLLTSILLILLSIVGMPAQVFLQTFGIRFIASRCPSLGALWREPAQPGGEE